MNKNSNIGCGVIATLIIVTILFVVGSLWFEWCKTGLRVMGVIDGLLGTIVFTYLAIIGDGYKRTDAVCIDVIPDSSGYLAYVQYMHNQQVRQTYLRVTNFYKTIDDAKRDLVNKHVTIRVNNYGDADPDHSRHRGAFRFETATLAIVNFTVFYHCLTELIIKIIA